MPGQQRDLLSAARSRSTTGNIEDYNVEIAQPSLLGSIWSTFLPFVHHHRAVPLPDEPGPGRRWPRHAVRQVQGQADHARTCRKTTFADVAGCQEAIEELGEIKEFLQEPAKFQAVGAKIPKGVLLYGPPGTGKTLLARAVAGEAGVPFYSISGSDFVEMFVGVGASRVRDLFEQAKENAPAIVFIDEIDAVGRHRGAGMGGGHDEREQTLNQLLVEMDGFDVRGGVILIAATNRPDILDPALLRPGRFDRQIGVDAPDLAGRHQILQVHSRGKPMAPDVDLLSRGPSYAGLHRRRPGQRAQRGRAAHRPQERQAHRRRRARRGDRPGHRRAAERTRLMSEKEKLITAYHEGGHALVAAALPGTDPVHKVTILPRGRALGYTMVLPDEDKYSQTRSEMLDKLAYMLGGRAAEEMVFHDPTTGAGNDIDKATSLARAMVTQYGMTERLGAIKLGEPQRGAVPGPRHGPPRNYSEDVAAIVDEETKSSSPPRTRRPSTSWWRTATCWTPWSSSCSTRRRSTRPRSSRSSSRCAGVRSARPGPARRTARPRRSRRSTSRRRSASAPPPTAVAPRTVKEASSSPRRAAGVTCTATRGYSSMSVDRITQVPRADRSRPSTSRGPRRRSASC